MRVATLRIERFRGISRLGPDGDDLALPISENNTGGTRVPDDPWARPPGHRPALGRSQRTMVS